MIATFAYGLIGGGSLLALVLAAVGIVNYRRRPPVPRDQRWDSTEAEVIEFFDELTATTDENASDDGYVGRHRATGARSRRLEALVTPTQAFAAIAEAEGYPVAELGPREMELRRFAPEVLDEWAHGMPVLTASGVA